VIFNQFCQERLSTRTGYVRFAFWIHARARSVETTLVMRNFPSHTLYSTVSELRELGMAMSVPCVQKACERAQVSRED
jgi:hypothetical protein